MEACNLVQKEVEKLKSKFDGAKQQTLKTLDQLLDRIDKVEKQILVGGDEAATAEALAALNHHIKAVKEACAKISSDHRDLHGSVSKIGKVIDRNFTPDLTPAIADKSFERDENLVLMNQVVCEHFLRLGRLDIAAALVEESQMTMEETQKEPFFKLNQILASLHQHNLNPALEWVAQNKEELQVNGSSLEFKLHRLRFIQFLKQGPSHRSEVLVYAKNLQSFGSSHEKEIQVLMGALLYVGCEMERHPKYASLFDESQWVDICEVFTKDACTMLGLSVESPLLVCFSAGCQALPVLLNIRAVMQQRQCHSVWSSKDELPVEVDLGKHCRYHSIFACPILRLQCTANNPPMKLVCGHVISRDALQKLTTTSKLKCPYCPEEQSPLDAKQVYF